MKNEYRNWSFLEWEDKVKEYGSIAKLAAAIGINKNTASKWMNKAKPTEVLEISKVSEEPAHEELIVNFEALEVPKKPKYPKEIWNFLDLLNSDCKDMEVLKAAAKDAEKWVLTPVSANR